MDRATELFEQWMAELNLATDDPEMAQTAERVTALMRDFVPGDTPQIQTLAAINHAPIVIRDIPFSSLCAHHLLPFFGSAAVAYRPNEKILGFGTVPRILASLARRPQLQERLSEQWANALFEALEPSGLMVVLRARQLCVEMRGAHTRVETETWAEFGDCRDLQALLTER